MFEYTNARRTAEVSGDLVTLATLAPPDILAAFERLARYDWQHLPHSGGLDDQPALYMYELDCVDEALAIQSRLEASQKKLARAAGAAEDQYSRVDV